MGHNFVELKVQKKNEAKELYSLVCERLDDFARNYTRKIDWDLVKSTGSLESIPYKTCHVESALEKECFEDFIFETLLNNYTKTVELSTPDHPDYNSCRLYVKTVDPEDRTFKFLVGFIQ